MPNATFSKKGDVLWIAIECDANTVVERPASDDDKKRWSNALEAFKETGKESSQREDAPKKTIHEKVRKKAVK